VQKILSVRSIDSVTFAISLSVLDKTCVNNVSAHLQDAKGRIGAEGHGHEGCPGVVKDRPALKVSEGAVDCDFQCDMVVIDFDKKIRESTLNSGDENGHQLTIRLERLSDKQH
jgi:hypothetical protein